MLSLQTVEFIISVVSLVLAYIISATLAGYCRTWVADRMGDATAEEQGLLTLNPFMHIDPIGFFFVFVFGYGWGRYIPINPYRIREPYRLLKQLCADFSDVVVHLLLSLISLTILLRVFGLHVLYFAIPMVLDGVISLSVLAQAFPQSSSLALAVALILVSIIYQNMILAAVKLIINGLHFALQLIYKEEFMHKMADYRIFLISIVLLMFLSVPIRIYFLYGIEYAGCILASLMGGM